MSNSNIEIIVSDDSNYIIEIGTQGPAGVDGAGRAVVQDTPPLTGVNGELWFDDSTEILKVYVNGAWRNQTLDDQFY